MLCIFRLCLRVYCTYGPNLKLHLSQSECHACCFSLAWVSQCMCVCERVWESACEWLFPAAPSLSICAHQPPLFQLSISSSYLFARYHTLPHSVTSHMSPFLFLLFFACIFLSSVLSSYSFEAYFLFVSCVAGCGEGVGLGGVDYHVQKKRVGESESLDHMIWYTPPLGLVRRERESESERKSEAEKERYLLNVVCMLTQT